MMTETASPVTSVGYIGMGIMGSAMAANLLKAGFHVTVWNRTASRCEALRQQGASVASSPADLAARGVQVVCVNVTDTPDVEEVLLGEHGIMRGASRGLVVLDHSTVSPVATQRWASDMAQQGVTLLDAPVSGGDVGARNGTLSIMVGGDAAAFERCRPVLHAMGKAITHVGPSGMGQVCKACNQVAVAATLMGVVEAMALAQRCGLDVRRMVEVVAAGAGGSWQMSNLAPRIADGDMRPGFMIDLVLKDLAIVADTAREKRLPLHGAATAENYFRSAAALGHGRDGTQAMARAIEHAGGFRFQPERHEP